MIIIIIIVVIIVVIIIIIIIIIIMPNTRVQKSTNGKSGKPNDPPCFDMISKRFATINNTYAKNLHHKCPDGKIRKWEVILAKNKKKKT